MFLIDDILMSPVNLAIWVAEKLKEQANAQMYDVAAIKASLERLQEQFDMDQISKQEFQKLETKLLEQLQAAQEYHKARPADKEGGVKS